jgi:Ser/Thr protein kinase RdoA (MazF antagonist)
MEWEDRSEAAQVERLAGLAQRALAAWGLADATLDLIKYRENAVFRVTGPDGARCVMRVHRPRYRSDDDIRWEVAWTRALADAGVATPDYLPTVAGDVLTVAKTAQVPEPRQCDLMAWVEGQPLGTLEQGVDLDDAAIRRHYRTVGEIAAHIEQHASDWTRPAGFSRPSWDVESLLGDEPAFGRFVDLDALTDEQRATLLRAREQVRADLRALGPADTLIHGDLIPDNMLVAGDAVRVIDFDDCGFSWSGFELATSVTPLLISGGFEAGLAGYLEGYRGVRAFPDHQLDHMPALLLARSLSYLGWPVGRPEIHSQQALGPFLAVQVTALAEHFTAAGRLAPNRS